MRKKLFGTNKRTQKFAPITEKKRKPKFKECDCGIMVHEEDWDDHTRSCASYMWGEEDPYGDAV